MPQRFDSDARADGSTPGPGEEDKTMSEGRSSTESATMPDGAQAASLGGAAAADPLHGGPGTGESESA